MMLLLLLLLMMMMMMMMMLTVTMMMVTMMMMMMMMLLMMMMMTMTMTMTMMMMTTMMMMMMMMLLLLMLLLLLLLLMLWFSIAVELSFPVLDNLERELNILRITQRLSWLKFRFFCSIENCLDLFICYLVFFFRDSIPWDSSPSCTTPILEKYLLVHFFHLHPTAFRNLRAENVNVKCRGGKPIPQKPSFNDGRFPPGQAGDQAKPAWYIYLPTFII